MTILMTHRWPRATSGGLPFGHEHVLPAVTVHTRLAGRVILLIVTWSGAALKGQSGRKLQQDRLYGFLLVGAGR